MVKKKQGLSDAEYIDYYNHHHAQKAVPLLLRHGILSYSLTYHLERDRKLIQNIMHNKPHLLDYDAIGAFVFFPNYLALAKFLCDKEAAALNGHHHNFMDDSQMKMIVGDEYILIENGQKLG